MDVVLAIDLGTSGPKVALVAESGAVVASEYEPTRLILTDDGGVEQDPDDWWRAITTAIAPDDGPGHASRPTG